MKKKLERDEEKAVMGGVLSGLAEYFKQDPALFRVAAIAFLIITGVFPAVILYLAAWVVMPKRQADTIDYEIVE
jgi:phage shock protein PspC (stress-responsive transcriptional regulator)